MGPPFFGCGLIDVTNLYVESRCASSLINCEFLGSVYFLVIQSISPLFPPSLTLK